MADQRDTTSDPDRIPDFVHIADGLYDVQRGLAGLSLAVDGLHDLRASHGIGHLVHLVERELERLRDYVEEVRPRPEALS
ncbi:hypothetical protein [Salinarimonas chemoclinalis]|uniref:hypothetical protein n=1 Tax=Salinarimonas chemoclinalis TaxID=3241599 RepID=UPI00355701A8